MDAARQPDVDPAHAPGPSTSRAGPRLVLMILAAAIVGAFAWRELRPEPAGPGAGKNAGAPVPVVVTDVVAEDVPRWLRGLGTVRAWNSVTVRPRVGGELLSVSFTEGQQVAAGDVLAQIDPRLYEIARDQAAAQLAQDEARLGAGRRQLQSSRDLVKAQAAGKLEFDLDAASVAELEATVRGDRARLAEAKLQLDYTRIVAPISGRTGLRLVDAGNVVVADDPRGLVTIAQLTPIAVVFTLPQANLSALRTATAQGRMPTIEALGEHDEVLAKGTLTTLDSQVDTTNGTISIKASFPNDDLSLWPGQLLGARILVETRIGALLVPEQAVMVGVQGPVVYVVDGDGAAQPRPVRIGETIAGRTIVEDGLVAGERVVIEGQAKLTPGAQVIEGGAS